MPVDGKLSVFLQVAPGDEQHRVAIDDLSGPRDEQSAIGIAIEGDTHIGLLLQHGRLQNFQMQRAAVEIDVAAVGRAMDGMHASAQALKKFGRKDGSRSIRAVGDDL